MLLCFCLIVVLALLCRWGLRLYLRVWLRFLCVWMEMGSMIWWILCVLLCELMLVIVILFLVCDF